MRKRNIIIGVAILEILAIPAAAHLHFNMDIKKRVNVISAEIKAPDGVKSYFVASDGPFVVVGKNLKGRTVIALDEYGELGEVQFGAGAQLPGAESACIQGQSQQDQVIYSAERGTIIERGDVMDGAVLFTVFHHPELDPEIEFLRQEKASHLELAKPCR